ncbi:unnamed protein product [Ixodes pacificus]
MVMSISETLIITKGIEGTALAQDFKGKSTLLAAFLVHVRVSRVCWILWNGLIPCGQVEEGSKPDDGGSNVHRQHHIPVLLKHFLVALKNIQLDRLIGLVFELWPLQVCPRVILEACLDVRLHIGLGAKPGHNTAPGWLTQPRHNFAQLDVGEPVSLATL